MKLKKYLLIWIIFILIFITLIMAKDTVSADSGITLSAKQAADGLNIKEGKISWNQLEYLNIFNNSNLDGQKVIAPGDSGSYDFIIENNAVFMINYTVDVSEVNSWNVPIVCRILRDGKYLQGTKDEWIKVNELKRIIDNISAAGAQKYTLEWKWNSVGDDNDTQLGASVQTINYILQFNITASQDVGGPATGDDSFLIRYIIIEAAAAGTIIFLFIKRKTKINMTYD